MTDGMHAYEEPLFVLKYRGIKVFWRAITIALGVAFLGLIIFAVPTEGTPVLLFKAFLGLLGLGAILFVAQLASFRELRLYNDRIVKVQVSGDTTIELANAKISGGNGSGGRMISITNQDMKISQGWVARLSMGKGLIVFEAGLADPEDVKRLNVLLAYLSGRPIGEFERGYIEAGKMVKEGYHPRIITKDTPTEALQCALPPDCPEEREKSQRRFRMLFIIVGLIVLIQLCVTAYLIWLKHQ
jgi:hypothetical protein